MTRSHVPFPKPLVWDSPSEDALGSVPLGNGELAANAWFTPEGTLNLMLARTDAWDEIGRLCKLTLVEVQLDPPPGELIAEGFEHRLQPRNASLEIRLGPSQRPAHRLQVWIDWHRPVVWLTHESSRPTRLTARIRPWRTEPEDLGRQALSAAYGKLADPQATLRVQPDQLLGPESLGQGLVGVAHRNESSVYPDMLRRQNLAGFDPEHQGDPLLHRVFGVAMVGDPGLERLAESRSGGLTSAEPTQSHRLALVGWTEQPATVQQWAQSLRPTIDHARELLSGPSLQGVRQAHDEAWEAFWSRSWIVASGDAAAEAVTRAVELQRYVTALAGRGSYPIKFNGSLFSIPGFADPWNGLDLGPDYRRWGGGYWFQNSRLIYWPTLASGDFELALPWIRMFARILPLARYRVEHGSHGKGAFFPETISFWGTMRGQDYGYERSADLPAAIADSDFIGHYFEGSLELSAFLIAHLHHSGDRRTWLEMSWPIVRDVLRFYTTFYSQRDEEGYLVIHPSQALESWHDATNPSSVLAGLHRVVNDLLALPAELVPQAEDLDLPTLAQAIPPLPLAKSGQGEPRILPGYRFAKRANMENPELYTVFPYAVAAKGTPLASAGRTSMDQRINRHLGSWHQTPVQYAMLGMAEEARDALLAITQPDLAPAEVRRHLVSELDTTEFPDWKKRFFSGMRAPLRFPGFYGPNFDWLPDQCHGGVAWLSLQRMAMQSHAGLELLPAWPQEWDVDLRLYAPGPRLVELRTHRGRIEHRRVIPTTDDGASLGLAEETPLRVPTTTIDEPSVLQTLENATDP